MPKYFLCSIFLCILLNSVDNARILAVFPLPSPSHFMMFRALLRGLAEKGHELDVVSHFPLKEKLKGYNDLSIADAASLSLIDNITVDMGQHFNDVRVVAAVVGVQVCEKTFETDVAKQLRTTQTKYDLLITEQFATDCFLGFAHVLNLPTVVLTSSVNLPWGSDRFGIPDNPAYIPTYFSTYSSRMTLFQRLVNTYDYVYLKIMYHWYSTKPSNLIAKKFFGADLPDLDVLANNISLSLVNSHFSMNIARPAVPNFIEVGGIHVQKPKALTQYFEELMTTDSKGIIYLSMGSMLMTESIPNDKLQPIFDTLAELPYKVIWKANRTKFDKTLNIPANIHFETWCPQIEILCHKNTKLFISHGGLMGSQEAIYCGVPRVGIPIFADQELNIMSAELMGLAVKLNYEEINRKTFSSVMNTVLENPKYTLKSKEMSVLFKDRPISPMDEAIFWVEYVIRHKGAPHLRSSGADLYLYQYLLLDVLAIYMMAVLVPIFVFFKLYAAICKKSHCGKQKLKST